MGEADQLRATLRQIAEQATQSVDTECGGQILRQIEALARGALLQSPGRRRVVRPSDVARVRERER